MASEVHDLARKAERIASELHGYGLPLQLTIERRGVDEDGNLGMSLSVGMTPPVLLEVLDMLLVYLKGKEQFGSEAQQLARSMMGEGEVRDA